MKGVREWIPRAKKEISLGNNFQGLIFSETDSRQYDPRTVSQITNHYLLGTSAKLQMLLLSILLCTTLYLVSTCSPTNPKKVLNGKFRTSRKTLSSSSVTALKFPLKYSIFVVVNNIIRRTLQ
jgi:hypothetical protein